MDDLELDAVGIVEEAGVVTRHVRPLAWLVLDVQPLSSGPVQTRVDCLARLRVERDVVDARCVPVVWLGRLRLTQTYRDTTLPDQVHDAFVALADDLTASVVPEHRQQLSIKRKASFERRQDEVEVVDACAHAVILAKRTLPADELAHERKTSSGSG